MVKPFYFTLQGKIYVCGEIIINSNTISFMMISMKRKVKSLESSFKSFSRTLTKDDVAPSHACGTLHGAHGLLYSQLKCSLEEKRL